MRWVCRIVMLVFTAIALYDVPWVVVPWGDESLVRGMALQNLFEAITIIAMLWFIHQMMAAEKMPEAEVKLNNVTEFRRVSDVPE